MMTMRWLAILVFSGMLVNAYSQDDKLQSEIRCGYESVAYEVVWEDGVPVGLELAGEPFPMVSTLDMQRAYTDPGSRGGFILENEVYEGGLVDRFRDHGGPMIIVMDPRTRSNLLFGQFRLYKILELGAAERYEVVTFLVQPPKLVFIAEQRPDNTMFVALSRNSIYSISSSSMGLYYWDHRHSFGHHFRAGFCNGSVVVLTDSEMTVVDADRSVHRIALGQPE